MPDHPTPDELRARLDRWIAGRGRSMVAHFHDTAHDAIAAYEWALGERDAVEQKRGEENAKHWATINRLHGERDEADAAFCREKVLREKAERERDEANERADHHTKLAAKVKRERDEADRLYAEAREARDQFMRERDDARAEVERLRAALRGARSEIAAGQPAPGTPASRAIVVIGRALDGDS